MQKLTRKELDAAGCDNPNCTHPDHPILYLKPACHPAAGTQAGYHKRTGTLCIECDFCGKEVAEVQVSRVPQGDEYRHRQ